MRRQRFAVVGRSMLLVGATLAGVFAAGGLEAQALKDVQTPDTPLVLKAQGSFFVRAASRGGSAYIHDNVQVGQILRVGVPRNLFRLDENAPHSVLFGGGIGITPLVSMAARLDALGHD